MIWMILFFLVLISLIEVYSASSNMTYKTGNYWRPIMQHASFLMIGVFITLVIHKIPCRLFKIIPLVGVPLSLILLFVALCAKKVNNASRWVEYGGVSFQPSEIAKGVLIVLVAMLLSGMRDENGVQKRAFKIILGITVLFCGMIAPENFSTAAMTFLVVMIMMFVAGVPWKQLGTLLGVILIAVTCMFSFLRYTSDSTIEACSQLPMMHRLPTWASRVRGGGEIPEDAKDYDITKNQQVTHARIAVATCNVIGRGPGNSVSRDFLPQSFSDFIYAIIFEELGFFGGFWVMFLYIMLLFRAARIAGRCENNFPAFLVMGLALLLVTQALVNMAVAVGVFPVTGQPLPLISKGGTSTIINCFYIGMILSVSHSAKKKTDVPALDAVGQDVAVQG